MQISLSSDNYSIIDSGDVFLFGLDGNLKMTIDADDKFSFDVEFKFVHDSSEEERVHKKTNGSTIILTCYNFEDTGTGLTQPVRLAIIEGKEVFLMFWSYVHGSENGKSRSVKYTIFMNDN